MKKSCTLCGGKLKDGICTECGMDNRKSDEMYQKALNQSDCKNMRLSHVHTDKKAEPYESPVINQTRRHKKAGKNAGYKGKIRKQKGKTARETICRYLFPVPFQGHSYIGTMEKQRGFRE